MMRGGRDYLTKYGGFVIPEKATVILDGRRITAREFLKSGLSGRIIRDATGELVIETLKVED